MITSLRDIYNPYNTGDGVDFPIKRARDTMNGFGVDMDTDFQRAHVWTEDQQTRFIGNVLQGSKIPPCFLNTGPHGEWIRTELVDGKQRITAAIRWADNEIPGVLMDGREVWFKNLDKQSLAALNMMTIRMILLRLTRLESMEFYIQLNRGGTVHTEEEIDKVRKLIEAEKAKATAHAEKETR